ncbi:MAG: type II secretion system F family protein, partial [Methanosarcinales archaeon]|nr:type II secretion system F family protein [Methanosarcinales archaeon]
MDTKTAIASLGVPLPKYIKRFALPIVIFGFLLSGVLYVLFPELFLGPAQYVLLLLPITCIAFVIMYPFSVADGKANEIDSNMHYYVTQLGALAMAQTSRKELFNIMAHDPNYHLLREESQKIFLLMDTWNLSLADACRFIGARNPSVIFADFLDRLAHAVQSGEPIERFLESEQDVVMNDYDTMYRGAIMTIDIVKEMFVSLIMSLIFLASFSAIMPIITGMDATNLMLISVFAFVMTDIAVIFFIKSKVPKDKIWQQLNIESVAKRNLKRSVTISLVGCLIVIPIVGFITAPEVIKAAIVLTPLLYTGRIASKEEARIKRKD